MLQSREFFEKDRHIWSRLFSIYFPLTHLYSGNRKEGTASDRQLFQSSDKKGNLPYADTKKSFRNSEKQRIKLDIFVNFLKKNFFYTLKQ